MKVPSVAFIVAFANLCAIPAQARLGESLSRIEARYGIPVQIENGTCARAFQCTYKHAGITIVVHFLDEKSQYESYSSDNGEPMDEAELQRLLEANRRGGKWTLKKDSGSSKQWDLNSGEVTATYQYKTSHLLEIRSSWWDRYCTEHPADAKGQLNDRLKDF
jgi:hypothetical protein